MGAGHTVGNRRSCGQHGHSHLILDEPIGSGSKGRRLLVAHANGTDAKVWGEPHDVLDRASRQTEEGFDALPVNRLCYQ